MRNHSLTATTAVLLGGALLLSGCAPAQSGGASTPKPSAPSTGEQAGPEGGAGSTARDTDLANAAFAMSWTDALEAAGERFAGDPVSLSLEWQRTAFAYSVELVSDAESYDAVFNADTGELMFEATEQETPAEVAEKRQGLIVASELIAPADALAAAVAAAPGPVSEWEIDDEDGRLVYEVQIVTDTGDVDVRVDARTREIVEIDS